MVRWNLPQTHTHPALVRDILVTKVGAFYTSWSDSGFPDAQKASAKLTITSRNLSSTKTVTAYYKADNSTDDDSSDWNVYGSTGVFNTSPTQTISAPIDAPLTHRKIRFRLVFETDSESDDPPRGS